MVVGIMIGLAVAWAIGLFIAVGFGIKIAVAVALKADVPNFIVWFEAALISVLVLGPVILRIIV